MFAPGHLGELTWWVPFELVDDVLVATRSVQTRVRDLPARVGVYFVLALALFADRSYAGVWQVLTAGLQELPGLRVACPSGQALGLARRRVGVAPLKALFEVLAGPLGRPATPGVRYRRWRTVAFDGCSSIKAADGERVRGWLGSPRRWLSLPGYPTVMLVALVETGTRGLLAVVFGSGIGSGNGEISYAQRLCHRLDASMLLLGDRAYDSNDFLRRVTASGAMFLVRAKCTRNLPVLAVLADGSFLSRLDGLAVRVIEAAITATGPDGQVIAHDCYRLVTTLLDPASDPAPVLVRLYHERWEIESAYYALKHTLLHGRVLRSRGQAELEQELWAILTVYQLLRTAMVEATDAVGADPDRASFTIALNTARNQVTLAAAIMPTIDPATGPQGRIDLIGAIGHAVQANLLGPRRLRI
ncbi:MAG TPA: IS4 family transposase, partial [Kineosporiaceae bacterium]|nr:IS4 family transposase [Kineosporiaceae bacterium]